MECYHRTGRERTSESVAGMARAALSGGVHRVTNQGSRTVIDEPHHEM